MASRNIVLRYYWNGNYSDQGLNIMAPSVDVYLDGNYEGSIKPGCPGSLSIDDNSHTLHFEMRHSTITRVSEEFCISQTLNHPDPVTLEYVYNIKASEDFSPKGFAKTLGKGIVTKFLSGERAAQQVIEKESISFYVEQDPDNEKELEVMNQKNWVYYKGNNAAISLIDQLKGNIFNKLDFSKYDDLTDQEKESEYMNSLFVPLILGTAYIQYSKAYLEKKLSVRLLYFFMNELRHVRLAETSISTSIRNSHMEFYRKGKDIISILDEKDVLRDMNSLKTSAFKPVEYDRGRYKKIESIFEAVSKSKLLNFENAKKLFDLIVSADLSVEYLDSLKKSLLFIVLNETDKPDLAPYYSYYREAVENTFRPLIYDEKSRKVISAPTVDMLIADAIHFNHANCIENVDEELAVFLDLLCPSFGMPSGQYNILQAIFNSFGAYKQEATVLEAMARNNAKMTSEQQQRLGFLKNQTHHSTGFHASSSSLSTPSMVDNEEHPEDKLLYDYRLMTMNDSEVELFFNNLSMKNTTTSMPIVVDEWNKTIECKGIEWDETEAQKYIGTMLSSTFGNRYTTEVIESGAYVEGWEEYLPSIIVKDQSPKGYPWLSFVISGDQMMANQVTLSIYSVYMPEHDHLSDSIYERNSSIFSKVQLLKKKQNPRINNNMKLIVDLIIKELEKWINSRTEDNIYG